MGQSLRSRIMQNRRKFNFRKIITIRNTFFLCVIICIILLSVTAISTIALKRKAQMSTVVFNKDKGPEVTIYKEENPVNIEDNEQVNKEEPTEDENPTVNIALLGEIMMGGNVGKSNEFMYSQSIKRIASTTAKSDFTYANFSTNITNVEDIDKVKSKYLVKKDVVNALGALGLDAVSIASDHIIDYPSDVIRNTIDTLEKNNIFVAGRKDSPLYLQKKNKKIAIVSTNSVIIGTNKNYEKSDISVYSEANLKQNIKEAKDIADIVIVDVHWGRDHTYGVTDQMKNIAWKAIDLGADMVIGSHALGVYPMSIYKEKPIIYSTGTLITDSTYIVAKESYIYDVQISKECKIEKIEMTPIYILDEKESLIYSEYDEAKSNLYLEQFNKWQIENGLNSKINGNRIEVKL